MSDLYHRAESNQQILESVSVKGKLHGLHLHLEVSQNFYNPSQTNIEAIYTFPLPRGAVLLDMKVKLGDKLLTGSVMSKSDAEDNYEDAITDGHSVIMLEVADDGICTVNVGNLMAGERAELRYTFSQILEWQGDALRILLPTTIAPRYGDATQAGWQPHQILEHTLLTEYPFNFALEIEGQLAHSLIACPSHRVAIKRSDNAAKVALHGKQAWLDRDLILTLTSAQTNKAYAQLGKDQDGYVALTSFCPTITGKEPNSACIKIVVDCSGSMNGESMMQAKAGLLRVLDNLRETDTFNIVRFGSTARAYYPECVPAKGRALRNARQEIESMEANLGGTEMGLALDFAYALKGGSEQNNFILLITDGEIHEHTDITNTATTSGHRIFTIGVGNAVSEAFVRGISDKTGGACELVSPNEGMATAIYRQFRRMYQPRAVSAEIVWPEKPQWQTPEALGAIFAGDTLNVFAGFNQGIQGDAILKLIMSDGKLVEQVVPLQYNEISEDTLSRIAAAKRIETIDDKTQATVLAVTYQLMSPYTNYLIVEEREVAANELPTLAKVPQMLAAGWGGVGSVSMCMSTSFCVNEKSSRVNAMKMSGIQDYDIPAFLRKQADDYDIVDAAKSSILQTGQNFINDKLELLSTPPKTTTELLFEVIQGKDWLSTYRLLLKPTLQDELIETMSTLIRVEGWDEREVVAAVMLTLLNQLKGEVNPIELRPLLTLLKAEDIAPILITFFEAGIEFVDEEWGWKNAYDLLPIKETASI